ncbi:MAG: hypothetical protein FRX49_01877 [Trebouxia sp. A1-2]|nr:MAG: hypothetical protein FRX49_01877 [Trebouxia sp. A1-2]
MGKSRPYIDRKQAAPYSHYVSTAHAELHSELRENFVVRQAAIPFWVITRPKDTGVFWQHP